MAKTKKKLLTIPESAEKANRTIASLHLAIKNETLLAEKDSKTKQMMIEEQEIERYVKGGLSNRRFKGELLYDKSKGEHTMEEVAEILKIDKQDLFYEIHSPTCNIKYSIKGKKYKIFRIDDIKAYQKLLKERSKHKKK